MLSCRTMLHHFLKVSGVNLFRSKTTAYSIYTANMLQWVSPKKMDFTWMNKWPAMHPDAHPIDNGFSYGG